jgi:hypothetical protein
MNPFHRIYVDYMIIGTSRITWELIPSFVEPAVMSFQLQVNRNADEPGAWVNVGSPVTNQLYALDTARRQFGRTLRINYRVVMTLPDGSQHTSDNAQVLGNLTKHQWLAAKAMVRRAPLKAKSLHSFEGWLLKRRLQSPYCTCVDPITKGVMNSNHALCGGTGRLQGYWNAAPLKIFDLSPEGEDTRTDKQLTRGTVNDATQIMGRCVGVPLAERRDVWVDAHSGRRYYVDGVNPENEINRVPILVGLKLALAPFSDAIYAVPLGLSDGIIAAERAGQIVTREQEVWRNQSI